MKKIVYGILATISGLVLLFSYRTSLGETVSVGAGQLSGSTINPAPSTTASSPPSTTTPTPTPTAGATTGTDSGSTSTSTGSGLTDGTYSGAAVNTRFGPVAVQITVSGGVVSDVQVPEYPSGNSRDRQINQRAIPLLVSETLSAQSARIDMVSGATYTSDGYLQSLQSALDQAAS